MRHKQKHDWLGCTLFNWVSWVELSCVAINTPLEWSPSAAIVFRQDMTLCCSSYTKQLTGDRRFAAAVCMCVAVCRRILATGLQLYEQLNSGDYWKHFNLGVSGPQRMVTVCLRVPWKYSYLLIYLGPYLHVVARWISATEHVWTHTYHRAVMTSSRRQCRDVTQFVPRLWTHTAPPTV